MTTIEDVARAAKVSTATVSRALTRPEMVADKTRTRVLVAAAEVGYQHNPSARALATGRSGLIGLTVPTLTNPFFAPIISGAQEAAESADLDLIVVVDRDQSTQERLLARLRGRVDGIVAVAPRGPARHLVNQARSQPVVTIDRRVQGTSGVLIDTPGGLAMLGRHLTELGHRKVAYLGGPPGSWMDRKRQSAFDGALTESGGHLLLMEQVDPTFAAGSASARDVLESECSAVVVYNSVLAIGLLHRLQVEGIRVPEDLSLACADDLTDAGLAVPDITAVHVPAREAGRRAIEMVLEELRTSANGRTGRSQRATHRVLPVDLVVGMSTAEPSQRPI